MNTAETQRDSRGWIPPAMLLVALGLVIVSVFSPWFEWSQHTRLAGRRGWLTSTNLNDLLPYFAIGTQEAAGAQTADGILVWWVGNGARLMVIGISISSYWSLIRRRRRLYQILVTLLLLPILAILFGYIFLNNLMVDVIVLEDRAYLAHIVAIAWQGPGLLVSGALIHVLIVLWQIRPRLFRRHI